MSEGTLIALLCLVHVLEARFYPRTKAVSHFVVVGSVICEQQMATVAPKPGHTRSIEPFDFNSLLTKLQFLVDSAVPEPVPELLGLRSQFWSFVEVSADGAVVPTNGHR